MTDELDVERVPRRNWVLLGAGLAAFVFAVFGICLFCPFIQDDWGWMARFRGEAPSTVLSAIFGGGEPIFLRPLAGLYLYGMYLMFGVNPVPFHVVALVTLIANALLVAAIVLRLTRDRAIAYATSFIYVAAAGVHIETLLWAMGIHDLGGSFLFLLAMLLFIRGRHALAAIPYLAGCFFKESVIVLPLALAAYLLVAARADDAQRGIRRLKPLAPVAVAFAAVLATRLFLRSPLSLGPEHPYSIGILGKHVWRNVFSYVTWLSQCLDPFLYAAGTTMKFVVNDLMLAVAAAVIVSSRFERRDDSGAIWFFLAWLLAGLLPAIFLMNHTFRYYAIYSLPAFAAAVLLALRVLLDAASMPRRHVRTGIIAFAAVACLLSAVQAHTILREGFGQKTFSDGTNKLVKRAATVIVVRRGLMKLLPSPPEGATILIADCDLAAFDWESGPRVWYGDKNLAAYRLEDFAVDQGGAYVLSAIEDGMGGDVRKKMRRVPVDATKAFAFRIVDTELLAVPLGQIPSSMEER